MAQFTIPAVGGEQTFAFSATVPDCSSCNIKVISSIISCLHRATEFRVYATKPSGDSQLAQWRLNSGQNNYTYSRTTSCVNLPCANGLKFVTTIPAEFEDCQTEIAQFSIDVKFIAEVYIGGTWLTAIE